MNNNNLINQLSADAHTITTEQIQSIIDAEIHAEIAWHFAWDIIESIELEVEYPKYLKIKAPEPLLQIKAPDALKQITQPS